MLASTDTPIGDYEVQCSFMADVLQMFVDQGIITSGMPDEARFVDRSYVEDAIGSKYAPCPK
jgi:hypothetical protein